MPHRGAGKGFGKHPKALMRLAVLFPKPVPEDPAMITLKELVDWASAFMVIVTGGLAGHYAAMGMTPVQWAGAVSAVLGSVTVAVAVRVWPVEAKAQGQRD
jgi:hypothetical protein